jgi:hypothetical protein
MKYFYAQIKTMYDSYEWLERAVVKANTRDQAIKKVNKFDFTHEGIGETQELMDIKEITENDYITLKKYLINI